MMDVKHNSIIAQDTIKLLFLFVLVTVAPPFIKNFILKRYISATTSILKNDYRTAGELYHLDSLDGIALRFNGNGFIKDAVG